MKKAQKAKYFLCVYLFVKMECPHFFWQGVTQDIYSCWLIQLLEQ